MKKMISIALALVLIMSATIGVFAMSDVAGTAYETAANAIVEKGYISGYTDGTYRPEKSLSRAEACSILSAFKGATTEDLLAAEDAGFTDMDGHKWAKPAVNYAVANGILTGYTDGTFRPAKEVSYAELAVMVVNAMGKQDKVTGAWDSGYMAVAAAEGYLKDMVSFDDETDLAKPASRGNTAIMVYNADVIRDAEKIEEEKPVEEAKNPLADFNGYAYGMINGFSSVLNEDGDAVTGIEFVFGDKVLELQAKKGFTPAPVRYDGTLYCLKMRNGLVTAIAEETTMASNNMSAKKFAEITTPGGLGWNWTVEEKNSDETLKVTDGAINMHLDLNSELHTIYVATSGTKDAKLANPSAVDGYRPGDYGDIHEGDAIRAFDVTKDDPFADVVIVLKK